MVFQLLSRRCKSSILLVLAFILSGCTSNTLFQSPHSVSTSGVDQMSGMLDADLATYDKALPKTLPDNVTNALLPSLNSLPQVREREARFDLAVNDVGARDFFRSLVKDTKYNMVVHPDIKGTISLELNNVTVPQVMELTKDLYSYDYEVRNDLYRVLPGGMRTEIFQINYLNIKRDGGSETRVSSGSVSDASDVDGSDNDSGSSNNSSSSNSSDERVIGTRITTSSKTDFWTQLSKTLMLIIGNDDGRTVVATPNAGIIVVRAMPSELASVKKYLERTELIMQRQVVIEAKILEVDLSEGYQQGVDWTAIESSSSLDENGIPKKLIGGNLISDFIESQDLGGVFTGTLKVGDFTGFIQLLGTQGNVQVLSSPRISTVNNQKAVIKVGTDEFFVTDIDLEDDNGDFGNNDSTSTDVTLTPFFSGIALDVTPQISEEGDIILHVHPAISDVEDQEKLIGLGDDKVLILPLAKSTIRETDSVIRAKNGQIVVIGGLIQNISQEQSASVPLLGDIPLLGELFKQKRYESRKIELVILLRPMISDDSVYEKDIRESSERFKGFRDEMTAPLTPSF